MKILMVLTSHDQLGNTGRKPVSGWKRVRLPTSFSETPVLNSRWRHRKGASRRSIRKAIYPKIKRRPRRDSKRMRPRKRRSLTPAGLADVKAEDFDTVFYPGGHGPMWDLAEDPVSIALLESFYNSGKPIALVCHSPGVLRHVKYQGEPLVKGKHVTGFTNGEEEEVKLTKVVPFLVEDELMRLGAIFEKVRDWQPFSIVDGRLITGQNPASSTITAQNLLKVLARGTEAAA